MSGKAGPLSGIRVIEIASIDRARTVFVWGPQPKPGKTAGKKSTATRSSAGKAKKSPANPESSIPESSKESS